MLGNSSWSTRKTAAVKKAGRVTVSNGKTLYKRPNGELGVRVKEKEDVTVPVVKVFLVDPHALVRAGFRLLVASFSEIEVVGEAEDGLEALELIKKIRPEVVLIDVFLKGLNGIEVTKRALKTHPLMKFVILSAHANEEYVTRALGAGASGYLLKHAHPEELEMAIKAVFRGAIYLCPRIAKHGITRAGLGRIKGGKPSRLLKGPFERLSRRQIETLQLIAEGHTTKEIASRLKLNVKTVTAHRYQLMKKLDIHESAGLVRYAIRMGMVSA